jgi:hypothetical protein
MTAAARSIGWGFRVQHSALQQDLFRRQADQMAQLEADHQRLSNLAVGQKLTSADQAILDVYFDGEGQTRKFALEKLGAERKLRAIGDAGAEEGDLGAPVWP